MMENRCGQRSEWQIWLPFLLMEAISFWSLTGMLLVMLWISIGFFVLRRRGDRVRRNCYGMPHYLRGIRRIVLGTYHLMWWPTYL